MEGSAQAVKPSLGKKPFALWVLFGALVYFGLALIAVMVQGGFFDPTITAFAVLFILTGSLTLWGNRWAVLGGTALGIVFLALFAPFIAPVLANPANSGYWLAITGIPLLVPVIVFGVLSLVSWKKGLMRVPYLASPRSGGGLLTLAVVGFIVGGLVAGNLAAPLISNLVGAGGARADVRIVHDASVVGTVHPFNPADLTVRVGDTVTWYNGDTMQHTVTSDIGDLLAFDSGALDPGGTFRFTFTQAGNYPYHCTPHPWMTGTIVVTR